MSEKEKVLQWIAESNKFGKEAGFIKGFENELNEAIRKENEVITTWMFGNELFNDKVFYKLRWHNGNFTVEKLTEEEVSTHNIAARSITRFEKQINEAITQDDNSNSNWFNEIENIYHTFSLIIDDKYSPGSRKEIENAKIEVSKIKNKYSGNKEFEKEISFLDSVLIESNKRKWIGSKFTFFGVIFGILVMFYMGSKGTSQNSSMLIDEAEQMQQNKIVKLKREIKGSNDFFEANEYWYTSTKKEIADLKAQEQTNQIIERIGEKEKHITKYEKQVEKEKKDIEDKQKEIDLLSSMNAEEYRDYKVKANMEMVNAFSGYTWKTLLWFILFVASSFPTVYTINKRGKKDAKTGWMAEMVASILGSARTVRYRRADGTTYDDNSEFLGSALASVVLMGVSIIIIIAFLPYIALIAFARNIVIPYFY